MPLFDALAVPAVPRLVRLGRGQSAAEPYDDVVMNDAALLELCDPCVTHCFGACAGVVPLAEGVEVTTDVLWPPLAVVALVGEGLHPDRLVFVALVVELLRSDTEALTEPGYSGCLGVNRYAVFSPINNYRTASASC